MSAGPADLRFLLPAHPRRVEVLGDLDEWRTGLEAAGIEVAARDADCVIAPARLARRALALEAPLVLVEGRSDPRLASRHGYRVTHVAVLPTVLAPTVAVPRGNPALARHAVGTSIVATGAGKHARNLVAAALVGRLRPGLRGREVALATREPGPPFLVSATRELDLPSDLAWTLVLGSEPDPSVRRSRFVLFGPGSKEPEWILKFAATEETFAQASAGLAVARSAGTLVERHAPRPLGRISAGPLHGSVETAAPGLSLTAALRSRLSQDRKLEEIDRVVRWLGEVASATATSPDGLEHARRYLAEQVVPAWLDLGAPPELVRNLPPLTPVLAHYDLWCSNVVTDGRSFVVVDWDRAQREGFPLWDLLCFVADAYATLDGALGPAQRTQHFVRLFRGESARSAAALAAVRDYVRAIGLPDAAVGPVATLCWLNRGTRPWERPARPADPGSGPLHARLAHAWLTAEGLGPGWSRWRA